MFSKKSLAVFLSKLKTFDYPSIQLEQYATDSEVAATILWSAFMNGDIEGKTVADLGCGTGILGVGALLLGAKKVYFVDIDEKALSLLSENLDYLSREFEGEFEREVILDAVENFGVKTEVVIENPPFGTKTEHADRAFLLKAFSTAPLIYSFHKTSTRNFVSAISEDNGFKVTAEIALDFPLKKTFSHHKKKVERVEVSCFRLEKAES